MAGMRENIRVGVDSPSARKKPVPAKLVLRLGFLQTQANGSSTPLPYVVQPNERFLVVRGIASGGGVPENIPNGAGGAGGYFKHYIAVQPGETLLLTAGPALDTIISRPDGKVIAIAKAGGIGNGPVNGKGGTATGQITLAGQDGSYIPVGALGNAQALCDGGWQPAESPMSPILSLRNAPDTLRLHGKGGSATNDLRATGFGAGGAKLPGKVYRPPTGGILVLEFYTADPR